MLSRLNRPLSLVLCSLVLALAGPGVAQDADAGTDLARTEQCAEYYGCIDYGPWPPRPGHPSPAEAEAQPTPGNPATRPPSQASQEHPTVAARPAPVGRFVQGI